MDNKQNFDEWMCSPNPINERNRMMSEITTDFSRLTQLMVNGVLNYDDYKKAVLTNANKLIEYIKEVRRAGNG